MIEKFFTTEQVANILQVHPFTILKFIKEGKLKGIKLGRVYRITESDVQEFLHSRMTQNHSPKKKVVEETSKEKKVEQAAQIPKSDDSHLYELKTDEKPPDDDHYYLI